MELSETIKHRRSCRDFLTEPISEADIHKILEAAVWAPSPLNTHGASWMWRRIKSR